MNNKSRTDDADLKMVLAVAGLAFQHEMTFLVVPNAVVPDVAWVLVEVALDE